MSIAVIEAVALIVAPSAFEFNPPLTVNSKTDALQVLAGDFRDFWAARDRWPYSVEELCAWRPGCRTRLHPRSGGGPIQVHFRDPYSWETGPTLKLTLTITQHRALPWPSARSVLVEYGYNLPAYGVSAVVMD